jgi:hypothetical protein
VDTTAGTSFTFSVFAPDGSVFPMFNVADSAIVVGGLLLMLLAVLGRDYDGSRHRTGGRGVSQLRSLPVPDGLDGMRVDAGLTKLLGLSRTAAALAPTWE